MDESANLKLPYIMAAQAQKHVTHNEALRTLDTLVQIGVIDKDLTAAPGSPLDGDCYIPAAGATGDWAGQDGLITTFQENTWIFHEPKLGWQAFVADEGLLYIHNGTDWIAYSGSGLGGTTATLNSNVHGAQTRFELIEEELTLSGASTDSTILIPNRAIVFAVSTRTTQEITGATSYDCGISGETGKYGGTLSIALNSTNSGVTGPTAYYANTPISVTANGSDFTGGKVRIAIHYMLCITPTS